MYVEDSAKHNPDDNVFRLFHMLEAAEKASTLIQNRARADLETDAMLALALTRLIEMMGEAAQGVSLALQVENPRIPWLEMIAARNYFSHSYFTVDHDMIWRFTQTDLPPLINELKKWVDV